jgi:DNA-binding response OmpR family regulator
MTTPLVDEYDVLRHRDRWVALGPIEARVARELVAGLGEVVPRSRLAAVWGKAVRDNTIDRQIHRLRVHAAAVGLALITVRGHGYVLDAVQNLSS